MKADNFTIITDCREQNPWNFYNNIIETATLNSGDYSIKGFEDYFAVERKSLADFIACCGRERERFKRELSRLRGYWVKAVVIEGSMDQIIAGDYRSKINPASVIGAIASWTVKYNISFILAGDRNNAEKFALCLMRNFHKQISDLFSQLEVAS